MISPIVEMPRIRTRTNNVDTRVQGCCYIRIYNDQGKVSADPNVFYLQRLTTDQILINLANEHNAYLV